MTVQEKLDAHFDLIFPELVKTIDETQSYEPILHALKVLRRLFRSYKPTMNASFRNSFDEIKTLLVKALNHEYSKVVKEGLRVAGSFLNTLRAPDTGSIDAKFKAVSPELYQAIVEKLKKVDIDIEVKAASIIAAASLVSVCHSALAPAQVEGVLQIYQDRLGNELTRDAALKGLTMIALNDAGGAGGAAGAKIPLSNLAMYLPCFFDLLKKTHRPLHLNTLECLAALTERYPE